MSFPGRWLCFAAKVVAPLEAGFLREPLLALGFDMDKPSAAYSAREGWLVLQCLARLNAPHLEEDMAQRELGRKVALALREQNFIKPAHLYLARHLPSSVRMLSLQKLAWGTPFAYVYTRERAGLWRLSFGEGMLIPFSLGLWEIFSEWLCKRWVVFAGQQGVLFIQEG